VDSSGGQIIVDSEQHTNVPGLYAAGDATSVHEHQVSAESTRATGRGGCQLLPLPPGPEDLPRINADAVGRATGSPTRSRVPVSRRGAAPGRKTRRPPGVIEPSGSIEGASSRAESTRRQPAVRRVSGRGEAARTRSNSKPALRRARDAHGEWRSGRALVLNRPGSNGRPGLAAEQLERAMDFQVALVGVLENRTPRRRWPDDAS